MAEQLDWELEDANTSDLSVLKPTNIQTYTLWLKQRALEPYSYLLLPLYNID